jgi:surface antigen
MKRIPIVLVLAVLTAALAFGCNNKKETGALAGAGVGAAAGAAIDDGVVGPLIGAVAGTAAGYYIGKYLEDQDREEAGRALEYTPTGKTREWRNEDTGYRYEMTPTDTFHQRDGRTCRNFRLDVYDGGKRVQEGQGTACSMPDGEWEMVENR